MSHSVSTGCMDGWKRIKRVQKGKKVAEMKCIILTTRFVWYT